MLHRFGVYDGHGGGDCSEYASKNLHRFFANYIRQGNFAEAIPIALKQSFDQCEKEFCSWSHKNNDTSGSCSTMAVVRGNQVFVGNAGDSKCIVFAAGGKGKHVDLNPRHGAELSTERKRILGAGGTISREGAIFGVLYPSRGFGDIDVKAAGKDVVIATPEGAGIVEGSLLPQPAYTLNKGDVTFLINASDGLWDFMHGALLSLASNTP
jgi:serine/threonine protein phosphatase PrpC